MKLRAATLKEFGPASDCLEVQESPMPTGAPGQVLVEMLRAPVNPADINVVEGKYGILPELPAIIGNEGIGRVVGGSLPEGWGLGDLVVPLLSGNWCSHRWLAPGDLVRIPSTTPPDQAAMLSVNPLTALALIEHGIEKQGLEPGDWIAQNAANSALGQSVIQIAKALGFHTWNLVRRPEVAAELRALGADCVVVEGEDDAAEPPEAAPKFAINAVGGASALRLANQLAPGGWVVTVGAMARQPLKIPNGLLIFKNLTFAGFWLAEWRNRTPKSEVDQRIQRLAEWMTIGKLQIAISAHFSLDEVHAALDAAATDQRSGKVLLNLAE